jgi:NAD(P)-dependent dehydrogenase (short-subunit alcohol dehydrogenase family)
MDLNLQGKVALITGSGSQIGFGHAIAVTMAKEGCDIVVNDINLEAAEQTASEIRNIGRRSIAIKADVGNSTQVQEMAKNALEEFSRIDILVNNAGAGGAGGPINLTREEDWVKTINRSDELYEGDPAADVGTEVWQDHQYCFGTRENRQP